MDQVSFQKDEDKLKEQNQDSKSETVFLKSFAQLFLKQADEKEWIELRKQFGLP